MRYQLRKLLVLLLTVSFVAGSSPFTALADEIAETGNANRTDKISTVSVDSGLESYEEIEEAQEMVSDNEAASAGVDFLDGMEIKGADSVGNMLAEKLSNKASEQMENNGCNIFSVSMDGNTAYVDMETIEDAKVVVGIYDEKTDKFLASGETTVKAGDRSTTVEIKGIMPQYYIVRAFLVGAEDLAPLCNKYETPDYTEDMQKFFAMTTDDFDESVVFNYDNDKTKNFLIFNENVIRIEDGVTNKLVSANKVTRTYEFENIDDTIRNLKKGDELSYEFSDKTMTIIVVDSVNVTGNAAIITGQDSKFEDVFDYIRIELESGNVSIDDSSHEEGVTYEGEYKDSETYNIDSLKDEDDSLEESVEECKDDARNSQDVIDFETFWSFSVEKGAKVDDKELPISSKIEGSIDINLHPQFHYNKTLSNSELYFCFEYTIIPSFTIQSEWNNPIILPKFKFDICTPTTPPVPIIGISLNPKLKIDIKASVQLDTKISGKIGFKVTNGEFENQTVPPDIKDDIFGVKLPDVHTAVDIYFGVELIPTISIPPDYSPGDSSWNIFEINFDGEVGLKISAKYSPGISGHLCKDCIAVQNSLIKDLTFGWKFLIFDEDYPVIKEEEILPVGSNGVDYGHWHWSIDYGDMGFGECPHCKYPVTQSTSTKPGQTRPDETSAKAGKKGVKVITTKENNTPVIPEGNMRNDPLGDMVIDEELFAGDDVRYGVTDENGVWTDYFEDGTYTSIFTAPGYKPVIKTFTVKGKATHVDAEMDKEEAEIQEEMAKVSMGSHHSARIDEEGNLWMWGRNDYGQLGNGTNEDCYVPRPIMKNVKTVSLGYDHSAAIDNDNNLWMWGNNLYGQLGDGTKESSSVPKLVRTGVKSVSLGGHHSAAIDMEGNLLGNCETR